MTKMEFGKTKKKKTKEFKQEDLIKESSVNFQENFFKRKIEKKKLVEKNSILFFIRFRRKEAKFRKRKRNDKTGEELFNFRVIFISNLEKHSLLWTVSSYFSIIFFMKFLRGFYGPNGVKKKVFSLL